MGVRGQSLEFLRKCRRRLLSHGQLSLLRSGFTMIETLVSLAVISLIAVVAFSTTITTDQINTKTNQYSLANSAVFAKVQEYENMSFENIPIGLESNDYEVEDFSQEVSDYSNDKVLSPTAKVYSQLMPGSGSLIFLRFELDFQLGSQNRSIDYATYIQLGGVGR